MDPLKELRPEEVIWGYWGEAVNFELNAVRLNAVYMEATV